MLREQVIGDLIWEASNADSMPARMKYNAASRYRLQTGRLAPVKHVSKNMYMVASEALSIHSLIDLAQIKAHLDKPCTKWQTPHTCMDVFRADPQIVRVWRVMWRCLPPAMRREKLIEMMAPSFRSHRENLLPGDWEYTDYSILGHPVCREAFRLITGIGTSSLSKARDPVMKGMVTSCARAELSQWLMIVATNKPKLYLDCRQWLEYYADTHAEQSPIS